jgi:hypothetical protein
LTTSAPRTKSFEKNWVNAEFFSMMTNVVVWPLGKVLGRKLLAQVGTLVTPDTLAPAVGRQEVGL